MEARAAACRGVAAIARNNEYVDELATTPVLRALHELLGARSSLWARRTAVAALAALARRRHVRQPIVDHGMVPLLVLLLKDSQVGQRLWVHCMMMYTRRYKRVLASVFWASVFWTSALHDTSSSSVMSLWSNIAFMVKHCQWGTSSLLILPSPHLDTFAPAGHATQPGHPAFPGAAP